MEQTNIIVDASPTKDFFIYMITRDIDVKAAIVELIDNAIDGARRIRKTKDYSGLYIKINISGDGFTIQDNCGGFGIETASKYAFKFGRPSNRTDIDKAGLYTGIFGIGMKRALFKMGNVFDISSKTVTESYDIHVDVDTWKEKNSWDFEMKNVVQNAEYSEKETGTTIQITDLNPEIKLKFSTVAFFNSLIDYVEKYKSVETEQGLEIVINGQNILANKESIIDNDIVQPYKNCIVDENNKITILAGITHSGAPAKAGWYIYCNGRLVVYADRTSLTGWGNEFRQYHNSFAMFRGYVYFESSDLLSLPWNTTKTGVDVYNRLYVMALEEMKNASNQIFAQMEALRKRYDVQNLVDIAAIVQQKETRITYSMISNISESKDFVISIPENAVEYTNVSFRMEKELFETIKKRTGAKTKKELGLKLVEYYCEMEEIENVGQ